MTKSIGHRAVAALLRGARRIGLDLRPMTTGAGRYAGVKAEWRSAGANALRGTVVETALNDRKVFFFVANDVDLIQSCHRQGRFYEEEELAIMARHYAGGTFVDIGANVGNHALFALLQWDAPRVVAFEPIPEAARILEINVALNGCQNRFVLHRFALSASDGSASPIVPMNNNLGATRLTVGDAGSIKLKRGDDVLAGETPSFIKIDTEGHEVQVLEGLRNTLARHRPVLFVEVEDDNLEAFNSFCRQVKYRVANSYRRYSVNSNFLMVPE